MVFDPGPTPALSRPAHLDNINSNAVRCLKPIVEPASGTAEPLLLSVMHPQVVMTSPGFHLAHNKDLSLACDDIDLSCGGLPVPGKDLVSMDSQPDGCDPFSPATEAVPSVSPKKAA